MASPRLSLTRFEWLTTLSSSPGFFTTQLNPSQLATLALLFAGGSPYDSTRKGERVLIHAATGGVGLVAVQFAQRVGATIFATAGSPGKVQHLRDMGVKYITSSRDAKVS